MNSLEQFVDDVNALPPLVVDTFYVATPPDETSFTSDPEIVARFFEGYFKNGIEERTYVRFLPPREPRKPNRRERRAKS